MGLIWKCQHNKNSLMLSRRAKGILDATPRKTKKSLTVSSEVLLNTSILQYDDDDLDNENCCLKLWLLELLHHILSL